MSSSSSVQFSCSVVPDPLQPYVLQHARRPRPSPIPRVCSNSCSLNWWCHSTISSSVIPFSSHLQYFPASGSFQMSQFFSSGGQSIGVLASVNCIYIYIKDVRPRDWTLVSFCSRTAGRFFTAEPPGKPNDLLLAVFLNIYLRLRKWC